MVFPVRNREAASARPYGARTFRFSIHSRRGGSKPILDLAVKCSVLEEESTANCSASTIHCSPRTPATTQAINRLSSGQGLHSVSALQCTAVWAGDFRIQSTEIVASRHSVSTIVFHHSPSRTQNHLCSIHLVACAFRSVPISPSIFLKVPLQPPTPSPFTPLPGVRSPWRTNPVASSREQALPVTV